MVQVDLRNVSSYPRGAQWYPVTGSHGSEGELLLDISFSPGMQMYNQPVYGGAPMQTGFPGQMPTTMPMTQPTVAYNTPTYTAPQPMTAHLCTATNATTNANANATTTHDDSNGLPSAHNGSADCSLYSTYSYDSTSDVP